MTTKFRLTRSFNLTSIARAPEDANAYSALAAILGALFVFMLLIGSPAYGAIEASATERAFSDNSPDAEVSGTVDALRMPQVPSTDARRIAEAFVSDTAATWRTEWLGAIVDESTTFVTSQKTPILYEFAVRVGGYPAGSLFVGATHGLSSVTSFTTTGESVAKRLRQGLTDRTGVASAASGTETFYYGGVGRFGMTAAVEESSVNRRETTEEPSVNREPGTPIAMYAFDFDANSWEDWHARFDPEIRVTEAFVRAEDELRAAFLASEPRRGTVRANALRLQTDATRSVSDGINAFANYYQEDRKWANGKCYAGCAPVAAAILVQYWDRRGYPGLLSSENDNTNWSTSDSDVRWTIDELRKAMSTKCNGANGSTTVSNIGTGLQKYITSRGVKKLSAANTSTLMWSRIIDEIDAGRPTLLHFELKKQKGGHGAVVYEYRDNWFTSNDFVCVATGWQSPDISRCYNVTSPTEPWYAITRVRK